MLSIHSELSCPICKNYKTPHKMDCQNRAYVKEQIDHVLDGLVISLGGGSPDAIRVAKWKERYLYK